MARKGTLRVRVLGDTKPLVGKLKGLKGKLAGFAAATGTLVAGAAAAGVAASIKSFADFDAAMTQSTAIMGDLSKATKTEMGNVAREVAKTTKFGAAEAAEAYFFLASAGLDAAASMDALPQVAKFAQAGMFDLSTATDLATDAQSALGLAADDPAKNLENLTRVTDVLVGANTLANASVEQFSTSLTTKAGGALRSVGKDVEEGTAALAVFADQGIKGERAGTILTATLEQLGRNSRENADAWEDLGVAVFDGQGNMRNMADIVADLEGGMKGMSTEQREAQLAALGFNKQAREGILALLGNSDAMAEYEEQLDSMAGKTDEIADKQLQTFWAQLGLLKDQFIDVAIQVGQKLMPHLEAFVGWLSDHSDDIAEWILTGIDKFGEFASTVRDWWHEKVQPALVNFRDWIVDNWPTVVDKWEDLKQWIDDTGDALTQWWEDHGRPAVEAFVQAVEDNWPKLEEAWGVLQEIIGDVGDLIVAVAETFGARTTDMADDAATNQQSISEQFGILMDEIIGLLGVIQWFTQRAVAAWDFLVAMHDMDIGAMIQAIDDYTGGALNRFVEGVGSAVADVIQWFRDLPGRIMEALSNFGQEMYDVGRNAILSMKEGISSAATEMADEAASVAATAIIAAKLALGISSPSKEFRKLGEWSGEGFNLGLAGTLDAHIEPSVTRLPRGAAPTIGGPQQPITINWYRQDPPDMHDLADARQLARMYA